MTSTPRKQTVLLFAAARDRAGQPSVEIAIDSNATVGNLRESLCEAFPSLRVFGGSLLIAVNEHYAAESDLIPDEAEIACFPPVSGG